MPILPTYHLIIIDSLHVSDFFYDAFDFSTAVLPRNLGTLLLVYI